MTSRELSSEGGVAKRSVHCARDVRVMGGAVKRGSAGVGGSGKVYEDRIEPRLAQLSFARGVEGSFRLHVRS